MLGMMFIGCPNNENNDQIIISITGIEKYDGASVGLFLSNDTNISASVADADIFSSQYFSKNGQVTIPLIHNIWDPEKGWSTDPFTTSGQYYVFLEFFRYEYSINSRTPPAIVNIYRSNKRINIRSGSQSIIFNTATFSPRTQP